MTVIGIETTRRKGTVKGRKCRNQTLNTKLTPAEAAAVESASEAEGKAVGEWLRDLALRELADGARPLPAMALMAEVTALRLLLINTLEPLLRGERMSPEQFKAMLQYVKANKRKAATDALAAYAEEGGDRL